MKIILGSKSKGRKQILEEMGMDFEIMVSDIDEKAIRFDDAEKLVLALARAKAEALKPKIFQRTIKECHRLLKNGGSLIIYTPNKYHLFELLKKNNFLLKKNPTHINLLSKKDICKVLKKNEFKILEAYFRPSHLPVYGVLEEVLINIPIFGNLFRRRICIVAKK